MISKVKTGDKFTFAKVINAEVTRAYKGNHAAYITYTTEMFRWTVKRALPLSDAYVPVPVEDEDAVPEHVGPGQEDDHRGEPAEHLHIEEVRREADSGQSVDEGDAEGDH